MAGQHRLTDRAGGPEVPEAAPLPQTQVVHVPPSTQLHRAVDDTGTLYAPTLLSWEAGLFLEDACPMRYEIEDTLTWIVLGDTNTMLNLQLTDRALVNLASLTNQAAQAMLHARGTDLSNPGGDVA